MTYFAQKIDGSDSLKTDFAENLLGAYKQLRREENVWYHGPIMWKGHKRLERDNYNSRFLRFIFCCNII